MHTIVARRGASAADRMEKFGFATAGTDVNEVFDNPEINAVLIATRHDSHSDLVRRALEAGKSVLVEKPLGLSRAEIDAVATVRETADGFFQIGFNRRFAPLAQRTREILTATEGQKFMVLRINAGPIPADHWTQNPGEGGGRILGEVCHFVDLARYFAATPIS